MPAPLRCDVVHGDNLTLLQTLHEELTIEPDLIYADPPFCSGREYNLLVPGSTVHQQAYPDMWRWLDADLGAQNAYKRLIEYPLTPELGTFLKAQHDILVQANDSMLAYLVAMTPRLYWMHQVLKETGTMALHCDPTASHYLKQLMDCVFGHQNFLSEIIWKRHSNTNNARRPGPIHDVILLYSKSDEYKWKGGFHKRTTKAAIHQDVDGRLWIPTDLTGSGFREGPSGQLWRGISPDSPQKKRHWAISNDGEYQARTGQPLRGTSQEMLEALQAADLIHWTENGTPRYKRYVDADSLEVGAPLQDVWTDIAGFHPKSGGDSWSFETQKPVPLLIRIIEMLTDPGDWVVDPYVGSGTTAIAAIRTERNFLGFEYESKTTEMAQERIRQERTEQSIEDPKLLACPNDRDSMQVLIDSDKGGRKVQEFAVRKLGGVVTAAGGSKGDGGVDGNVTIIGFDGVARNAIISVKSSGLTPEHVTAFTRKREEINKDDDKTGKAVVAIIMAPEAEIKAGRKRSDALKAGEFVMEVGGLPRRFPRVQFVSFEQLFDQDLETYGLKLPGWFNKPDYSQVPEVVRRRTENQELRAAHRQLDATRSLVDSNGELE